MEISAKQVKFALAANADTFIVEINLFIYLFIYLYEYICGHYQRSTHPVPCITIPCVLNYVLICAASI